MKRILLIFGLLFIPKIAFAQAPTISPLTPLATPGGSTVAFSCTANCGSGGTWSCGAGCTGSIVAGTGVYTPPATLAANQSLGGYQLLPNDHIFNIDISALPADTATHASVTIGLPGEPGLSRTGNVTTVVWSPSGIQPPANSTVTIAGADDSSFNGTVTVVSEGGCPGHPFSCLTYSNPGADTTSGNGTVSFTYIAGSGPGHINFLPSLPIDYANGSTPTDTMSFYYTPENNGTFQTPQWPDPSSGIQAGWFDAISGNPNVDHHMLVIDTTTGNLNERYQYFAVAAIPTCTVNGSNSATCTITPTKTSSGFARAAALGKTVSVGSFTGGDTYLNGIRTLTAATATSITFNITHATASTSTTGSVTTDVSGINCSLAGTCNSRAGIKYTYKDYVLPTTITADAAGLAVSPLVLRSQEVNYACANAGSIKHALRFTNENFYIKNTFVWPATKQASPSGIVPYGTRYRLKAAYDISGFSACAQIILTQLKHYGMFIADGGLNWQVTTDFDNMWPTGTAALKEITNANISIANWETVDESSLMEVSTSGAVNTGEYVCFASSTGTTCTNVAVQGTALNVDTNQYYITAGTPQQQLTFYSNGAFTCAMSPTVGSITSDCKYTPPASQASATKTTVTATSSVNAAVKAQMIVYVTPAIARFTQDTVDFTDSQGAVWYSGGAWGIGMANVPSWQGCCQRDNSITGTDYQLFYDRLYSSQTVGDYKFNLHVPAGTYRVTFNNGTSLPIGEDTRYFYAQGALIATVDSSASAGGQHKQWSLIQNVTVGSDNLLSFYNAGIGQQASQSGDISSISVQLVLVPGSSIPSGVTVTSGTSLK